MFQLLKNDLARFRFYVPAISLFFTFCGNKGMNAHPKFTRAARKEFIRKSFAGIVESKWDDWNLVINRQPESPVFEGIQ